MLQHFHPGEGPGDIDWVLGATIHNYFDKELNIISSESEFEELNGKVLRPGENLDVQLFIPAGFREFIKATSFRGKEYIYIGLTDKDQPDPLVYRPKV